MDLLDNRKGVIGGENLLRECFFTKWYVLIAKFQEKHF